MNTHRFLTLLALCGAAILSTLTAHAGAPAPAAAMPTQEEMWQIIQTQQKQIEELTALVKANQAETAATRSELVSAKTAAQNAQAEASSTRQALASTQAQLEATTLAVEEAGSFGSAGWWENTSVGGYGELHANFYENADNQVDFHRFVLFVNHEYNDWITLYTELEVEHSLAGDGQPGEVELEQAFVRMDWTERFSTDAGLFLMPVGIINETHEPNTFYGVERNNIESRIIPSTWWEAGLKGTYRFDNGFAVDAGITSGLDMTTDGVIRGSRQKVANAINNEAAFVGRAKYTGIAGLELGASVFYQSDMAQSVGGNVSGLLSEFHADYSYENFRLRALYARWDLSGTMDSDAENQYGFYIEPSYRWNLSEKYGDLGVYVRYSDYEYYTGSMLSQNEIYELGVNYWPHPNVVFKADIQEISESDQYSAKGDTVFNLGVGYQF